MPRTTGAPSDDGIAIRHCAFLVDVRAVLHATALSILTVSLHTYSWCSGDVSPTINRLARLEYRRYRVYISALHAQCVCKEVLWDFCAWIVVGLIAGWLAGQVMKGGGYGVVVDIVLGIVGGLLGGWIFGQLGIWPGGGMIGSILVAFVGAVILVWITRLLKKA